MLIKPLVLLASGILSLASLAQTINESHELLWEISGNGLDSKSYLFGSLHSNDRRLFNLTDSTYFALNEAELIVLETDVFSMFSTLDTRVSSIDLNYDSEGKPYGSSSESSETIYGDEDGMPQFLDAYFEQYCFNADKQFFPLESVEFQLSVFSDIKTPSLENLSFRHFLTSKNDMVDLYLEGDIYRLDEMLKGSLSMYAGGYQELIIDRNLGMAQKLDSLMQNSDSKVFCAVGAGHLAGPQGLINLLRGQGYSVRKVVASFSENKTKFEQEFKSVKSYNYRNDELQLNVIFPGKPQVVTDDWNDADLNLIYRDLGQGNTYEVEVYYMEENHDLKSLAQTYIASPEESPMRIVKFDDGSEAYEGIGDAYSEGIYWVRIMKSENYFVILKCTGGNKFINSNRSQSFFNKVWID